MIKKKNKVEKDKKTYGYEKNKKKEKRKRKENKKKEKRKTYLRTVFPPYRGTVMLLCVRGTVMLLCVRKKSRDLEFGIFRSRVRRSSGHACECVGPTARGAHLSVQLWSGRHVEVVLPSPV